MSIQSVSSSSFAEPLVQRRPAPERDVGGQRESFVLPREEPSQQAAASARDSRSETVSDASETRRDAADARRDAGDARRASGDVRREAGDARRATDEAAATASETPSDSAAKPAVQAAAAETGAKAPAAEAGKAAEAVPVAQAAAPNLDIAALVSIAIAAQADNQPAKGGEAGEAKTGEAKVEKPEGEPAEAGAATEPKADGVAVANTLVTPAVVLAPPVPVPTLPTELAAGAPSETAGEEDLLSGKAGSTTAQPLLARREAAAALAAGANPSAAAADASAVAVAGSPRASKAGVSSPAQTLPLPVGADQAAKSDAAPEVGDKLAELQALTQAQGPAAAQASGPADPRPADSLQQAPNLIDLSALGQQGGNRVEPLRILTGPEQLAPQASAAPQAEDASASPPTPLHVLPIEIGLRALAGARQFDIRLDPGELGRVDVNLSISDTGEVTARLVVDRVETLHLLQRDARTLERAFEQAGLKPSDAGVDITLRDPSDQSGFRQNRQQDEAPQRARVFANGSETGDAASIATQPAPARRFVRLGGVDLSI
ncbi:flagellar hook-length control protein FliK [Bosea vaviloviae]|uniref:Flagellar hook-length control protein-like C-terminal domain-containing protein n=1 Tax=Bosea vaviloviae TaxID=1526658 RepID=A0A0N1F489_9HYPH|nr:flagellar hook-length control protein FliK [Bosea vaviloviae]KPH80194.1 hypothetical protein AE618_14335 [Bosea vaviloviae]